MAKSTVVSILPVNLREEKPGQFPGIYVVPKAPEKGSFSMIYVEEAYYLEPVPFGDERTPPRKLAILSEHVARSIVDDWSGSQLAVSYDPEEDDLGESVQSLPGLFWIPGSPTRSEIAKQHTKELNQAMNNQATWFSKLVKIADDDWARYGRHNVISDIQRTACKWLNLERPWNFDVLNPSMQKSCPACMTAVHPKAVICATCKNVLDPDRYKLLTIAS